MADPFLAEIRLFGFNFPPNQWAQCDGQLMPISQNTALFALLGTNYGGNGVNIFGLPNLNGNVAVGAGAGPGLTPRDLGEMGGEQQVTLVTANMPPHTHQLKAEGRNGGTIAPSATVGMGKSGSSTAKPYAPKSAGSAVALAPLALKTATPAGGGLAHNNQMPYLTVNFCIALQGTFPPRP